jgi:hypothetical protein
MMDRIPGCILPGSQNLFGPCSAGTGFDATDLAKVAAAQRLNLPMDR